MLHNVAPKTAKGSYITLGNRGATNETRLGGPITIAYDTEAADTQSVDLLDDDPFQDAGTGGPGTMSITLAVDPASKEYEQLYQLFTGNEAQVFNLYLGKQKTIYNEATARVAIAAGVATFSVSTPPWGSATEKGAMARGQYIQVGADELYRIDGLSGADQSYTLATKLAVTPRVKADGTTAADQGTAIAYKIVDARLVYQNWLGRVSLTQGINIDAGSTVVQGNVTIAPERILAPPVTIPVV